ncbi:hypothetical protein [Silvibacterium sp.]|uniref:hypothetical protein n=1 Tax=Silvibacterium sp. TaxID=1964179 RepID=UPI0039E68FD3
MKTAIRSLILLMVVLWLGGVMFFPILAYYSFSTVPDTHIAGTIVAKSLHVLHEEGLFAGATIVVLLLAAQVTRALRSGPAPVIATLLMLGLTAFSQFWIIPKMEADRIAVGGAIDTVPATEPHHAEFNRLHHVSEKTEQGVLLLGLILIVLISREPQKV